MIQNEDGRAHVLQDKHVPSYVTILRIHGPFLFGMTDKLADATGRPGPVRAYRHPTLAEYDGDRRVWAACAGNAKVIG